MGRRIPSEGNPFIHPTISLSLIAAWIAVTIAIIAALCGVRSRKSSSRAPSPSPTHKTGQKPHIETEVATTTIPMQQTITTTATLLENPTERFIPQVQEQKQLPSTSKLKETQTHIISAMSTSKRKLSVSLSMKLGGRTLARYSARKEEQHEQQQHQQQQQQLKPEDSIWMKTIILGERCRVPNEEDAIIYDGKGNRIAAYPPRMPRSLPVSRTNSLLDPDSLPF